MVLRVERLREEICRHQTVTDDSGIFIPEVVLKVVADCVYLFLER